MAAAARTVSTLSRRQARAAPRAAQSRRDRVFPPTPPQPTPTSSRHASHRQPRRRAVSASPAPVRTALSLPVHLFPAQPLSQVRRERSSRDSAATSSRLQSQRTGDRRQAQSGTEALESYRVSSPSG